MMIANEKVLRERQRLAWIVLLGSFFVCAVVTVAMPFVVNAFLQNATELMDVRVQANQGTVRVDSESGVGGAVLAGGPAQLAEAGASVVTGNTETALITFFPPDNEQRLARLQVYGNTIVRVQQADAPQFALSDRSYEVALKLEAGRVRLALPEWEERPLNLYINTPQGDVLIRTPGQYSIIVTNEATQVAVQEGAATVTAVDGSVEEDPASIQLLSDQRAEVPTGQDPIGPLDTERDLIQNGDFSASTDRWTVFTWRVERADQPKGTANIVNVFGEPRLQIYREGIGHADLLLRQTVQQDVTDFETLQLALTFQILGHDLAVCGVQGSECPIFVRLNYIDEAGVSQTWQHGFFAVGEINPEETPDACISCAVVQSEHDRVPLGQDYFYEVDIRTELARQGFLPPRFIESVELVSSGHSFVVQIVNVDLLARE